jgi:AraC-like DNA-binding protein
MPHAIAPIGLHLERVGTPRSIQLPGHGHHHPVLALLQRGGLEQSGHSGLLEGGGLRLAPAGSRNDLHLLAGTHLLVVECMLEGPVGAHPLWQSLDGAELRPGSALSARLLQVAARGERPGGAAFAVEDLLLRLLASEARRIAGLEVRPAPAALQNILHDIRRDPGRPVRVGDFARAAGVHRLQVNRWAREWLGRPLWQYVVGARLELARLALLDSALPLATIAAHCGFHDQSHLTRAFGRRFGESPARFRRRYQAYKTCGPRGAMVHQ